MGCMRFDGLGFLKSVFMWYVLIVVIFVFVRGCIGYCK